MAKKLTLAHAQYLAPATFRLRFSPEVFASALGGTWPPNYFPMNMTIEYNSLEDMNGTSPAVKRWAKRIKQLDKTFRMEARNA